MSSTNNDEIKGIGSDGHGSTNNGDVADDSVGAVADLSLTDSNSNKSHLKTGDDRSDSWRLRCYTPESLDKAIQCVSSGKMALRAAAKKYNIPKSTLHGVIKRGSFKVTPVRTSGRPRGSSRRRRQVIPVSMVPRQEVVPLSMIKQEQEESPASMVTPRIDECPRPDDVPSDLLIGIQDDSFLRMDMTRLGKPVNINENLKRTDYLEWPDYFMAIAFLSAQRSKDPGSQVGACIVNKEKKIVGIGYNGMPNGCSDDLLPWRRTAESTLDTKYPYVCHAELNAIMNKNSSDVKDCTMYVALFPCNECAKLVIQSGIREVIYMSDKYHENPEMIASRTLLDMAGVTYRQFFPKRRQIVIDFDAIDYVPFHQ